MDKKIAGLLGAVAGIATIGAAHAAVPAPAASDGLAASSYADLLAPIPNASALLQEDNAARTQKAAEMTVAQVYYQYPYPYYGYGYYSHHHHHHHHNYRRYSHHHHHHHNSAFIGVPGVGGVEIR
jgi:hypothetical protein